ncbi:MAG: polysaccharide deacetylase family protein [Candidatus Carbobacillus sp.]|nr:polysaccharide deacetylase family protein [Candidatus Carbobacillus sp.]
MKNKTWFGFLKHILFFSLWLLIITACGQTQSQEPSKDLPPTNTMTEESMQPEATPSEHPPSESMVLSPSQENTEQNPTHGLNEQMQTPERSTTGAYAVSPKNYRLVPLDDQSDKNVILITVDDAPQGASTEALLDLFDQYDVKAIWFLNGIYAVKHPDLVKKIYDHGHIIGNHSWSHPKLKSLNETETEKEIVRLNDWIEQTTGERPRFFRPPFGVMTEAAKAVIAKEKMQMMNWTWGSLDWELKTPDKISENVLSHAAPGTNFLFHDKKITVEAMKQILPELKKQGYHFALPTEVRP